MDDECWETFSEYVYIPESVKEAIKTTYSNAKECKEALIDPFLTDHPSPSWLLIAKALYETGIWKDNESCILALENLQQLFPTGMHCIIHVVSPATLSLKWERVS